MNVEVIVRIEGREVADFQADIETREALPLEEQTERLKNRLGQVVLEVGFQTLALSLRRPCCCGQPMENKGRRDITVASQSGDVTVGRTRYRCRSCGAWQTPADGVVCCGRHRITRLLGRNVCQLATLEHFTRMEQLLCDQHGVHLGHDPMMQLVHDVGGVLEERRLLDADDEGPPPVCELAVAPRRIYVSCDGIMFCTNQREPHPDRPGEERLIWKQMRVGCVSWQDETGAWQKRVVWGQEEDFRSFGRSLWRLACRCGYREAQEKIFAADGGGWCWTIQQEFFADAQGVLDWYHASEHVWSCGRSATPDAQAVRAWVESALTHLWDGGGVRLTSWLKTQLAGSRGRRRAALESLLGYLRERLDQTNYPAYRAREWLIGTGMMESTAKQLVGVRLKGPGMHWCVPGATAITALRAQDLNGCWHTCWKTLTL